MFLGYALLQIPDLCGKLISWMSKTYSRIYKNHNKGDQENNRNNPDDVGTRLGPVGCVEI